MALRDLTGALYASSISGYSPSVKDQHEPGTLRSELVKTVYRTWVLNELLEEEVSEPVGRGPGLGLRTPAGGSKAPWNGQAAVLVLELHRQARYLESDWTVKVSGHEPSRGNSDRNTWLALYQLTNLMEAVNDIEVRTAMHPLKTWVRRAEVTLGKSEPIRRVPREFGHSEPVCPWCGYMTLRCHVATGTVFCVNPGCRDRDGKRPQGSLGTNDQGLLTLTWQDGSSRIPEPYREEAA